MGDIERIAAACLRSLDVTTACGGGELARRRWGEVRVWWVQPTEVWGESELTPAGILLAEGLPIERENFRVALHVGEDFMRHEGMSEREILRHAEPVAAALLMPPAEFIEAAQENPIGDVAFAFCVQEQAAILRLGETMGVGVAVVGPARVRMAGEDLGIDARAIVAADIYPRRFKRIALADQAERVAVLKAA